MIKSGVYQVRNLVNNKLYIGSATDLRRRKHSHFTKLAKNTHRNRPMQADYNEYGKHNFVFEPLLEVSDFAQLSANEQVYIDEYKGTDQLYNIRLKAGLCTSFSAEVNAKKGRPKTMQWKPIYQIDPTTNEVIKEWNNSYQIAQELNLDRTAVGKACRHRIKTSGGYIWRFKEEYNLEINCQ